MAVPAQVQWQQFALPGGLLRAVRNSRVAKVRQTRCRGYTGTSLPYEPAKRLPGGRQESVACRGEGYSGFTGLV